MASAFLLTAGASAWFPKYMIREILFWNVLDLRENIESKSCQTYVLYLVLIFCDAA